MIEINLSKAFIEYPNLYKGLAFELGRDIITHNVHTNHSRRNSIDYNSSGLQNSQRKYEQM